MLYKVHYDGIIQQYVETDSDTVETDDEVKEFMRHNVRYGGAIDHIVKIEPMYKYMVSFKSTTICVGSFCATSEEEAKEMVKKYTNIKDCPFWQLYNKVEGKRKHIQITKEEN